LIYFNRAPTKNRVVTHAAGLVTIGETTVNEHKHSTTPAERQGWYKDWLAEQDRLLAECREIFYSQGFDVDAVDDDTLHTIILRAYYDLPCPDASTERERVEALARAGLSARKV
jgi:hypothetical protein